MSASSAASQIRRKVLGQMAGGVAVVSLPVGVWWWWAQSERMAVDEAVRTKVRIPGGVEDTYDYLITEKCRPGDVLLFDRRCERCAAGPWQALACLASRQFLTDTKSVRSVDTGRFDHIGVIVPGYIKTRHDEFDPTNLLLLEATPNGIVARPLKERLERSASRSILLLQLACPGEQRNLPGSDDDDDDEEDDASNPFRETIRRTREHVERELRIFRDKWTDLSDKKGYKWIHSTVSLGGALVYGMGMQDYVISTGPLSPSAFIVLTALQHAAAAQNIREKENLQVKPEDFLRDYRFEEKNAVHLRPGWRFLAPIALKETSLS